MNGYVELISTHPSLLLCLRAAAALNDGAACIDVSLLGEFNK
jgi:hypothetical protein